MPASLKALLQRYSQVFPVGSAGTRFPEILKRRRRRHLDALDSFADAFSAGDFLDNYGAHDDPAYIAQANVVTQIRAALNKHLRGY